MHLDHIAVAVTNLEEAVKVYEDMGLEFADAREEVADQKVKTAFASIDAKAHLELLEPIGGEGPIQKFIDKNSGRGGIHHLCFSVNNIEEKMSELTAKGYQFLYELPRSGANGMLINFIHPKSTGGVLVELAQKNQ